MNDILQKERYKLFCGDCLPLMQGLPNEIIDLTVTSPPYDNLRKYNGYVFDFKGIAEQLFRITKVGGVLVWVVSDATIEGDETGTSLKQALYFKKVGFNLHDTMIWIKDGGGAVGSNRCYTQNFEYMFVLSKGTPKSINLICDKPNASAGKDKSGVGRRLKNGEHKIEARNVSGEFSRRNNYWYIPPQRGEHPAVFPDDLARDHIISWSNENDIVFDPMMGEGTTGKKAIELNRKFIGNDISGEYVEMARKNIENAGCQLTLFDVYKGVQ